jgi:biopolymer transport protein ExbB/TolQ
MNIGALLQSAIYIISASLLYPAMALLVAGFAIVVASCGAALAEWAFRPRESRNDRSGALSQLEGVLKKPGAGWGDVERFWDSLRLGRWKKLDYLRVLARLSPAMGLVGTLVPMSTGLASLSQGDVGKLSGDIVLAFSTTVVGLCTGVAAYILHLVRSRWLEAELGALRGEVESRAETALGGQ